MPKHWRTIPQLRGITPGWSNACSRISFQSRAGGVASAPGRDTRLCQTIIGADPYRRDPSCGAGKLRTRGFATAEYNDVHAPVSPIGLKMISSGFDEAKLAEAFSIIDETADMEVAIAT